MANVVCSSYPRVRETATAEVIIDIRLYDDLASSVALWYCRGKIKNRFCFSFIFKNPRLKLWAQTDTVSWIAQSAKKKRPHRRILPPDRTRRDTCREKSIATRELCHQLSSILVKYEYNGNSKLRFETA